MMARQGKVWGWTKLLYRYNNVEIHEVRINKDGYCSRHSHKHKSNQFYVMSGKLKVIIWKDYGNGNELEDVTIVGSGEMCVVPPGDDHRFIALEDTHALEIYDVRLNPADIVRVDHGGMLHYAEKTDFGGAPEIAGCDQITGERECLPDFSRCQDDLNLNGWVYRDGGRKNRHSDK